MSDGTDLLAIIGGGGGIVAGVVTIFKWLGGRMVAREDEDKKVLQAKVEEGQKAERSTSESLLAIKYDIAGLRSDLATFSKQTELRANQQDKELSEVRTEFKEEMRLLEHRLKQDMQRIVSAPPRGKGRA
jgi:hypothetical protein